MAQLGPAQLQQLIDSFQQLAQQLGSANISQGSALASAATLTTSLDALLGKFMYDPEAGQTFDQWHQRYGSLIEDDGKDLGESTKVRLLIGKLGDAEYTRFRDSTLPSSPDQMAYKDVLSKLKALFGETRSLFVRCYECLRLKQQPNQDVSAFIAQVNAACENAEMSLSKETMKYLIMVVGLRDEHHDLRQKCLQLLEEMRKKREEMTLEALGEECRAFQLIRESAQSCPNRHQKMQMRCIHGHSNGKRGTKAKKGR